MDDLTEEFLALKSADERENFWKELAPLMDALDEEQRALFAISCSRSLAESTARLNVLIVDIDQAVEKQVQRAI